MGNLILVLLVYVLMLGFTTFTGAEKTASIASSEVERLLELQKREEEELANLKNYRRGLMGVDRFRDESKEPSLIDEKQINYVQELSDRIDRLKSSIDAISTKISEPNSDLQKDSPFNFALSLLSTKIGAVLLLVFGAQILVSLYRYTLRLASFSDSRADALILHSDKDLDSEKLKEFLNSDQIEFVNRAEAPTKQAVNIARDFLGIIKDKDTSNS